MVREVLTIVIAGAFALKTLEPDTIPLIALAVQHRLASLINDSIAARDHRLSATHLKPPPFVNKKRKRAINEYGEEEDSEDEFDEFDDGRPQEKEPAWDHVIFDDQEKILGVLERVDREEEKNQRRARMLRDEKENEARELAEAIAASEAAEREAMGYAGPSVTSLLTSIPGSLPSTPGPSKSSHSTPGFVKPTPAGPAPYGYTPTGKPKKEPKAKKKKEGPLVSAKNMTADVTKRLSDQTAMRSVGGRQFSWMSASGTASPGFGSPTPGSLPKPKFAPASSLPNPSFNSPSNRPVPPNPFDMAPKVSTSSHPLSRLANVPAKHDASRAATALQNWQDSQHSVELKDLLWALERERGMGVGSGSAQKSLTRSFCFQGKR